MIGATLFLIRIARALPSPRAGDIAAFGLLAGAALGMRVLGLLLVIYVGFAIVLYLPRPWLGQSRALALRDRIVAAAAAGAAARLCHHDPGMALGGAGAAQSDPRPARILRISVPDPHRAGRPGLRDGERAAAVCADLHPDPGAAADAVRRGAGDDVRAVAAAGRRFDAAAAPGYRPGRADGDFSAGLRGDLPRPGLHRIASFPVRDSGAGGARRHRPRRGGDGARERAAASPPPAGLRS